MREESANIYIGLDGLEYDGKTNTASFYPPCCKAAPGDPPIEKVRLELLFSPDEQKTYLYKCLCGCEVILSPFAKKLPSGEYLVGITGGLKAHRAVGGWGRKIYPGSKERVYFLKN